MAPMPHATPTKTKRRATPYWVRRRLLTDDEVCARYAAGENSIDLGIIAQCSNTTIISIIRSYGGAVRPRGAGQGARLLSDQIIVKRYVSGEGSTALARAAGCKTATVYKILTSAGITKRHSKAGRRPNA
jgi:hypothetical protein